MSCYLRHLKGIFNEAGIEVTRVNKKSIDQVIHRIVDTDYKKLSGHLAKAQTADNNG